MDYRWMITGLVLVMACGPQVSNEPGLSGGETTGSSSGSTETSSSTGAVGVTTLADGGTDSRTGTGTGAGADWDPRTCGEFADEAPSPAAETVIEFHNSTDASLLLASDCGLDYLAVTNDAGWRWPGEFCSDTCHSEFLYGCFSCDGCNADFFRVVGPGGVVTIEWAGNLYDRASPPESCGGEDGLCGTSCEVQRNAMPAGEVSVRIVAARQDTCEAAARDPQWCSCPEGMTCDNNVYGAFSATAEFVATGSPGETIVVEALD